MFDFFRLPALPLIGKSRFAAFSTLLVLTTTVLTSTALAEDIPLDFKLEPSKQIFSHSEGLVMVATWLAKHPVKLCLAKDLLGQMQVEISRSGKGKLSIQPLVIQDNSHLYQEPLQVLNLQTGQSIRRRVNLKRYHFGDGEHWVAGDYTVKASFTLCGNDNGSAESTLPSRAAYFMLMD
jgi:hypothetical protein